MRAAIVFPAACVSLLFLLPLVPAGAGAEDAADGGAPQGPYAAVLLKDLRTGRILKEHRADAPLPPASLTKIMTAALLLEQSKPTDTVVITRAAGPAARGARIGLRPGEKYTVSDLLRLFLVTSANDACLAAAIHVAGTEGAFVDRMNLKAGALGLRATRFVNACGHDADGHLSTARDIMALAEYAIRSRTFNEVAAIREGRAGPVNGRRSFRMEASNKLLAADPDLVGIKTGLTKKAGPCLVARSAGDGHDVLLVLLNAPDRWETARALLAEGRRLAAAETTRPGARAESPGAAESESRAEELAGKM
ncbi:MAG: serine hydrolase [Nitrospirota bacterium]